VSSNGEVVSEKGKWTGSWTADGVARKAGGDYMAVWRRQITEAGTPAWSVATEVFAPLD
jgi:hypothetical protein